MPRLRIERFYYRSGQIHTANRELNGCFHGICRTWHCNGQLAYELRYRHGLLHGVCRQWDGKGRLLGSFRMIHGTGVQRYWFDNGQLRSELTTRDGRFHGRLRNWLRDGTLIGEDFLIEDREVSRAAYLRVAQKNPDWPQYVGETLGRVKKFKGNALERRTMNLFAQSVLQDREHADARTWLNAETKLQPRSLARFRATKAALQFVEQLYATGATSVIIFAISAGKRKKLFADALLVQLPRLKSKRAVLRKICLSLCTKRGGAAVPEREIDETHLFMNLA